MARLIDIALWLPLALVVLISAFAGLIAPAGSCGSQNPGTCFGLGIFAAFIGVPLALICTPIAIWRLIKRC